MSDSRKCALGSVSVEVASRARNCSCKSRSAAATSTGVGVEWTLLCGEGSVSVSIWESWLKKLDMEGRRVRGLGALVLMLCSTEGEVRGVWFIWRGNLKRTDLRRGLPLWAGCLFWSWGFGVKRVCLVGTELVGYRESSGFEGELGWCFMVEDDEDGPSAGNQ